MAAFRMLAFLVVLLAPCLGRTQPFRSVTIRPSGPTPPGERRLQILPNGDVVGRAVAIGVLMALAYEVPANPSSRVASLPDSIALQDFDIEAKTTASLELGRKDVEAQRHAAQLLLQSLLRERFGLVLGVRVTATPVYVLTFAPGPRRLTSSTVTARDCILDTGADGCHRFAIGFGHPLNGRAVDMFDLAQYLGNWTDLPVVDRTGSNELFTTHSPGWRPMRLPPPPPGSTGTGAEFANLPALSTVLEGLGLQLHREEVSLPFYTVERIAPPGAR